MQIHCAIVQNGPSASVATTVAGGLRNEGADRCTLPL